jgi:hypothetical protein
MLTWAALSVACLVVSMVWGESTLWWDDGPKLCAWFSFLSLVAAVTVQCLLWINK